MIGRQAAFVVATGLLAPAVAGIATANAPTLTATQYGTGAAAVCKVANAEMASSIAAAFAASPSSPPSGTLTPFPKLPKNPKSLSKALAALGTWAEVNSKTLNTSLKAFEHETSPAVIDPKLAVALTAIIHSLREVHKQLAILVPPQRLAKTASEALADEQHDLTSYSLLLENAKATKLSFFGFVFALAGEQDTTGTQERTLWKQLDAPACNFNS